MQYVGIAAADLDRPRFTPYEFDTEGGVPVRLHDMTFLGFGYQADPPALTLRFVYDDPDWTPPGAIATPVVVLHFAAVRVRQWEDEDPAEAAPDARTRVVNLDQYAPSGLFALETGATTLVFSAERLAVRLEAGPGS